MTASLSWTVAGAIAALASAAGAAVYTYLTYRLVRSQNEPNLVVYVRHDESRRGIIQIIIENIGRGLASDVSFALSHQIPVGAFGFSEAEAQPGEPMIDGPLIEGIPALGPGDSRKIIWGQFGGLYKALGDGIVEVKCQYRDGARRMPPATFRLDVRSFKKTDAAESDAARVIRQLERIVAALERGPRP